MSISISDIQLKVVNAILGIAGGDFRRSTFPLLMFGKTQQTVAHLSFQVGTNQTTAISGRQKPSEGVESNTQIHVLFAYRLRPLAQNADYDNLLNKEQSIIKAILDRSNTTLYNNSHYRFENADRTISDSGEYFFSNIFFNCYHYLPIN